MVRRWMLCPKKSVRLDLSMSESGVVYTLLLSTMLRRPCRSLLRCVILWCKDAGERRRWRNLAFDYSRARKSLLFAKIIFIPSAVETIIYMQNVRPTHSKQSLIIRARSK